MMNGYRIPITLPTISSAGSGVKFETLVVDPSPPHLHGGAPRTENHHKTIRLNTRCVGKSCLYQNSKYRTVQNTLMIQSTELMFERDINSLWESHVG